MVCSHSVSAHVIESEETTQSSISFSGGPTFGLNNSNFINSGVEDCSSIPKVGFYGGGLLRLGILRNFSLEGNLTFFYKESEFSGLSLDGTFRQWGAEFGIYALLHIGIFSKGHLNLGLGPYTDFGFSAKYEMGGKKYDLYERREDSNIPLMALTETGVSFKVGYEFHFGLELSASYNVCVGNVTGINSNAIKMHPQSLKLGVGWIFGNGK